MVGIRNYDLSRWVSGMGAPHSSLISMAMETPRSSTAKRCLNFDGTTKWRASGPYVGSSFQTNGRFSIPLVADIQNLGAGQVVFGGIALLQLGRLLWQVPMDGFTAIGDFGGSGTASIAIVSEGRLSLVSATGKIIWTVYLRRRNRWPAYH